MIAYATIFQQRPIDVEEINPILICNHIKIRRCGMIANTTTVHKRPIDIGAKLSDSSIYLYKTKKMWYDC